MYIFRKYILRIWISNTIFIQNHFFSLTNSSNFIGQDSWSHIHMICAVPVLYVFLSLILLYVYVYTDCLLTVSLNHVKITEDTCQTGSRWSSLSHVKPQKFMLYSRLFDIKDHCIYVQNILDNMVIFAMISYQGLASGIYIQCVNHILNILYRPYDYLLKRCNIFNTINIQWSFFYKN